MKREGSGSVSISQRHESSDPDPHQNVMDPKHWFTQKKNVDEIYIEVVRASTIPMPTRQQSCGIDPSILRHSGSEGRQMKQC
jgi:hypothetical protein